MQGGLFNDIKITFLGDGRAELSATVHTSITEDEIKLLTSTVPIELDIFFARPYGRVLPTSDTFIDYPDSSLDIVQSASSVPVCEEGELESLTITGAGFDPEVNVRDCSQLHSTRSCRLDNEEYPQGIAFYGS